MSSPFIWAGIYAKSLKGLLNLNDTAYVLQGTADPSSVAQNAPQGSIYLRTGASGGSLYLKQDAGSSTNWNPISAGTTYNATAWTSFVMTIAATTTAPTRGTIAIENAYYRRLGDSMEISYQLSQSGTGTAGSGTYLWTIPASLSINTGVITGDTSNQNGGGIVGSCVIGTSGVYQGHVKVYDSTTLALVVDDNTGSGSVQSIGSSFGALSNTGMRINFKATVPISGWLVYS